MGRTNVLEGAVLAGAVWIAAAACGCASAQSPAEAISRAEISIRKADEVYASQYAALDLLKAREKLDAARQRAGDGDTWVEARRLAEKAEVDAQLAEEKARATRAEESAEEVRRSIEALRSEVSRQKVVK